MKHVTLALALSLATTSASAQSLWARASVHGAEAAARHREAAAVDALFVELAPRLVHRFALDPSEFASLHPERLRRSALAHVDAALALDPDDVRALTLAANLRARGDASALALRQADRALALAPEGPDLADVLFTRALAALHLGRYEEARDAWQRSLAEPLTPSTRAVTLGNLADTLLVLRDVRGAVDAYRGAVEADPDNDLAWLGLGVALDRAGVDPIDVLARGAQEASNRAARGARGASFEAGALVDSLERPEVFFEPTYERYYHTALAWEAGAREHEPGGRAELDPTRAQAMRRSAAAAWSQYLREAPPDDPWRARASLHVRRLGEGAPR